MTPSLTPSLRIALCQINPTVGDISGNSNKILSYYQQAVKSGVDLALFPECALPGYPPEDLLLRRSFVKANESTIQALAKKMNRAAAVIGFVHSQNGKLFNSAAVIHRSKIIKIYSKKQLPNYGVFDEKRYFSPGHDNGLIKIKSISLGISICEDIWEQDPKTNPVIQQSKQGAKILANISASPYYSGKFNVRFQLLRKRVRQTHSPILYVNMIGGQDELIFDGRSMVLDQNGRLVVLCKSFTEDLKVVEFEQDTGSRPLRVSYSEGEEICAEGIEEIYQALVLGTRDYVEKNGFKNVVLGLSGGIDSSLTACIAVAALGKERVLGVLMPSRYSSRATTQDAKRLAEHLGIQQLKIPIEKIFTAYLQTLKPVFRGRSPDITEENLQSRIRGTILMALSNKFGHLVLTTGNKSEVSVGYSTLYGDTAGGFAVLKDIPKIKVYELAKFINKKAGKEIIPKSVFLRPPTAELKPNQKDQDTLPPYPLLDKIIEHYVEKDEGAEEILRYGIQKKTLEKVIRMIDSSEYKRRQSPPGIKITPKSFGKDRRMPITNRFRES